MHGSCQIDSVKQASLDAQRLLPVTLVHEPAAASGAEIAVQLASAEGLAGVDADGTFMRGIDGEGWEDGPVAHVYLQGFWDGGGECDVTALATAVHGYDET
ncbi:hypothetical protein MMC07_007573 [Pseudocyphellaria aurata]|nr:hypothetical protein [Pseudocyphellaria aurata]